ncbi:Protein of unknown function (DUF3108) [Burkholderiales bacterium JOSHI_001]|nr:Protein of unknown function (DUF3108) [Burkholderiales bacterium JOSHI_001]
MAGGLTPTATLPRWPRRLGGLGLALGVLGLHLLAGNEALLRGRFGGDLKDSDLPRRIEVAFVRDLLPSATTPLAPAPAPAAKKPRRLPAVAPQAQAASQPAPPEPPRSVEPTPAPEPAVDAAERVVQAIPEPAASAVAVDDAASATAAAEVPAVAASAASAASAAAPPFAWPPSTRLSYVLNGNYRGELQGRASVEWVREGSHYQVHLTALVGPSFAPLMARRLSSDGELGEQGLLPRRFDGEQRVGFSKRQWTLHFNERHITLADGRQVLAQAGAQDEASQFVQLAWLFTTQPQRLVVGQAVDLPLALPRRVDRWVYDVVGEDQLSLPFGPLPAFHLKPRRPGRGGEMTAQIWIAPTLQYLPVRILIHQDEQTWVDLMLERAPQQEAPK